MRRLIFLYIILAVIFICASCSDKQYQTLFQEKKSTSDTSVQENPVVVNQYHIKSQDLLQIRNLQDIKYIVNDAPVNANTAGGNASQGQTFQVEEDGTVALPALGRIPVAGLTRVEAQKLIEDLYRKSLLKDPIIDLKIVNLKVTIFGEVRSAGDHILTKDKTTLVELIGEAGGLTERANEKNIKIIRGTGKDSEVIQIDLSDIRSINDPRTILHSGDIIYVAQNRRAARSDNLQNFSTVFQPVLILFNTFLILYTLIHR